MTKYWFIRTLLDTIQTHLRKKIQICVRMQYMKPSKRNKKKSIMIDIKINEVKSMMKNLKKLEEKVKKMP
jgi:hypothetical protein